MAGVVSGVKFSRAPFTSAGGVPSRSSRAAQTLYSGILTAGSTAGSGNDHRRTVEF